jgi:hypothetical protein
MARERESVGVYTGPPWRLMRAGITNVVEKGFWFGEKRHRPG